ncbi:MAG TPA: metallopeptidase TldD-related protein [Mycobacteriales bacterium]
MTLTGPETVERALAAARGDHTTVIVGAHGTANLRFAGNTLTTDGAMRGESVTVVSVVGRGVGVQSTTAVRDADDLEALVRAAEAEAEVAPAAEDFGDPVAPTTDDDFADAAEYADVDVFTGFARALGEAFDDARRDGIALYGFAQHEVETTWLGSSSGTRRRHVQPTGTVEWNAKNGKPGGSVWQGQSTHDFRDVDVAQAVAHLRTRLMWGERQVSLEPGRYETLLPPTAMADLLIYAYWTAAGRDAHEGRTVYSRAGGGTRIGEALAPQGISLRSDPYEPGLGVIPFLVTGASSSMASVFDNGLPLEGTRWIDDGKLTALVQTRASARDAGTLPTGFVGNLILDGGDPDLRLEDMVTATDRGLLLTCLWYIRAVDPETLLLTGLTRDGVYLVEHGEIVGGVNNFRFNESPVDLLGRMAQVGVTETTLSREWGEDFTWTRMPPVRIPDFNCSSVSPAS